MKDKGTNLAPVRIRLESRVEQRLEVIDVRNEKLDNLLVERVLRRDHVVLGMRQNSGLEDDGEICKGEDARRMVSACSCPKSQGKHLLVAVIRFLSDFFSKTLRRSRT